VGFSKNFVLFYPSLWLTFVWTNNYIYGMIKIQAIGFEWDAGNSEKCQKHGLCLDEIEDFFRQKNIYIAPAINHSQKEQRFLAAGKSTKGRYMFVVFTLRKKGGGYLIRPISARYMHEKEAKKYDKKSS
jgi:uncharacterized DUF497 family protein